MNPTRDAPPQPLLSDDVLALIGHLIRHDPILGRGTCSSWDEVTPSDFEAAERVRMLVDDGVVRIDGDRTPDAILRALRAAEPDFWRV